MASMGDKQPRYWALGQMILSRVREFVREPAVLFWVYGFPILMTATLGMAFRNKPVEQIAVDIVDGPRAAATRRSTVKHPGRTKRVPSWSRC